MPFYYDVLNDDEIDAHISKCLNETDAQGKKFSLIDSVRSAPKKKLSIPAFTPIDAHKINVEPPEFADPKTGLIFQRIKRRLDQASPIGLGNESDILQVFLQICRSAGVNSIRLTYNGGSDEGYAKLDSIEMPDMTLYTAKEFASLLLSQSSHKYLLDLVRDKNLRPDPFEFINSKRNTKKQNKLTPLEKLSILILDEIPYYFMCILWEKGFGTGTDSSFYGAALVDLPACTIVEFEAIDPPWAGDDAG